MSDNTNRKAYLLMSDWPGSCRSVPTHLGVAVWSQDEAEAWKAKDSFNMYEEITVVGTAKEAEAALSAENTNSGTTGSEVPF